MKRRLEEMRKELRETKEKWRVEREELEKGIEELKRKIAGMGEEWREICKKVERKLEIKEREERRKNVIMKEVIVKESKRKEAVKGIFQDIGVRVNIGETRRIGGNSERGTETILMKLHNEEQRKEVWTNKNRLRGRKEKIEEDLIWGERKMRWRLEEIAGEEEKKENRVRRGYGRLNINGQWWK